MKRPYFLGLYEKAVPESLSLSEKLEHARRCGYDFLELSIDETDRKLSRLDWSGKERFELLSEMDKNEIPIRSMCLSGHRKYPLGSPDEGIRERGMEIMEKAVVLADDLGIRIIQLAGYDVYYEEGSDRTRSLFRENLKRAVELAARHGVMLGFETMETPFMDTVEKAMKYVNEIGSPYLGVYPDAGNLTNASLLYKTGVCDDMEKGRSHIVALHLKETVPGKYREIPFFTGHVDFEAITRKARELGVYRFVTEMWDVGSAEWEEDIRKAVSGMRTILDKAFS